MQDSLPDKEKHLMANNVPTKFIDSAKKSNSQKLLAITLSNAILITVIVIADLNAENMLNNIVIDFIDWSLGWLLWFVPFTFVALTVISLYYAIKEIINLSKSKTEGKLLSILSIILTIFFALIVLFWGLEIIDQMNTTFHTSPGGEWTG